MPAPPADATCYERTSAEPPLDMAPLEGSVEAPVGIVGGGLAGLALALSLAERGVRAVLLEAVAVGNGASGRNGGMLSAGFTRPLARFEKRFGREWAERLFRASVEAVDLVGRRIDRHAMRCRHGSGVVEASWFDDPAGLRAFVDDQNRRFDRGLVFWPREELRRHYASPRYFDGIFDPKGRHLDPLALCRGHARAAIGLGALIHEASPATGIERHGAGWRVTTPRGQLDVERLVVATSVYGAGLVPRLARSLLRIVTYIIVTAPLDDPAAAGIAAGHAVYDDRFATGYYRLLPDGRLLWGGRIGLAERPPDLIDRLRTDLALVYPALASVPVDCAWSGRMAFARHRMPVLAELGPGLWVVTGFGGHGLNTTAMAGELLARAWLENDDGWRLLAPFGPVWNGGQFGKLAAQLLYHGHAARDGLLAAWHWRRAGY